MIRFGRKSGFTLVELLVYMALLSVIVLVAGRAFTDSTKFRVRTQNMLRATQEAENVAMLFKSDVSQMGAKRSVNSGTPASGTAGDNFSNVYGDVFIDPDNSDSSSFQLDSSGFSFRYVRYDAQGHYVGVDEARWFVVDEVLKRACRNISGTADSSSCKRQSVDEAKENAVDIATGVKFFQVLPARPNTLGGDEQLFPPAISGDSSSVDYFRLVPRNDDIGQFATVHVENALGEANFAGTGQKLGGPAGPFFSNYDNENQQILDAGRKVNELIAIGKDNSAGGGLALCKLRGGKHNGRADAKIEQRDEQGRYQRDDDTIHVLLH